MTSFQEWWSHIPERIDPYIIAFDSFRVGWYGLMYLAAFLMCYLLAVYRIRREGFEYTKELVQDYIVWAAVGLIAGARLGYVLFYNFGYYIRHPLEIILPFEFDGGLRYTGISGMSYHGGVIGVALASIYFLRRHRISFWEFSDFFVPVIPLAYTFGRIGNFINGELYGRATEVPWAMYFPLDPEGRPRHPSQLYEAFFEGIFLFAVLWSVRRRPSLRHGMLGLYLIGYGTVRFFIEFVREPDRHLGTVLGPLSMGQVLCLAMVLAGALLFALRPRQKAS